MSDPLSAAISAAVVSAIEAQIPNIVEQIARKINKTAASAAPDEFVRLNEVCALLKIHKTTAHRLVLQGKLPRIEHLGKKAGYRRSTLDRILLGVGSGDSP